MCWAGMSIGARRLSVTIGVTESKCAIFLVRELKGFMHHALGPIKKMTSDSFMIYGTNGHLFGRKNYWHLIPELFPWNSKVVGEKTSSSFVL